MGAVEHILFAAGHEALAVELLEARGKWIYHTTSIKALLEILRTRKLKANPFVSFGGKPYFGDISGNDAVIVFDPAALPAVMEVKYNESWYDKYPDQASYIAGEGWQEQYTIPDECIDEDGFEDDTCVEEAYREAELESFLYKRDEREWISKAEGQDVKFPDKAIFHILVTNERHIEIVQDALNALGLQTPVSTIRRWKR